MCETYAGKDDDYDLLEDCYNQKEINKIHDLWDEYYGEHPKSYEVYVLTDGTKPGDYNYGPLFFGYEPFYVGHGEIGRHRKSMGVGRQLDKYCFKTQRMIEIISKGGSIRPKIVGYFYTKTKAALVEKKLMNLIPRNILTNSLYHLCEVPLVKEDYKLMINGAATLIT